MSGKIQVTVQAEERMMAITELAIAIRQVAEALNRPTQVFITGCTFTAEGDGITIDTADDVTETTIKEI